MTQTYQKIQRQIEALQRQAEKLKHQEVAGVIERIKVAIDHYGLTAEQLGLGGIGANPPKAKKGAKSVKAKIANAPAYMDGQGNEWGGRGPRPRWLRDALAAGRSIEEFSVKGAATKGAAPQSKKTATKRKAKQYKDANGNQWSGFGPKPRWLKEQLAAGASLEQFAS